MIAYYSVPNENGFCFQTRFMTGAIEACFARKDDPCHVEVSCYRERREMDEVMRFDFLHDSVAIAIFAPHGDGGFDYLQQHEMKICLALKTPCYITTPEAVILEIKKVVTTISPGSRAGA
jgi:hypothetical protein